MFADAEIRLGSKVFKVHKNIVCLKSTYFMLCFMGRFQVGTLIDAVHNQDGTHTLTGP